MSSRPQPGRRLIAVAAVLAVAVGTAVHVTGDSTPGTRASAQSSRDVVVRPVPSAFDVLVFSRTTGFRHDSIPDGIAAVRRLGRRHGFGVTATEDPRAFSNRNLRRYEAVVWLSTTGDVLNDRRKAAFTRYVRAGGGYVGVHAAADTEYEWPWYGRLVGAYFRSHPAGTPAATVRVESRTTPSSCFLPTRWHRTDEWYNYRSPASEVGGADFSPRGDVRVIASLDESTYDEDDGSPTADDHPIAWYQPFQGGRSFYTGGGHTRESYGEPLFRAHLLGGIRWAAGRGGDDCVNPTGPRITRVKPTGRTRDRTPTVVARVGAREAVVRRTGLRLVVDGDRRRSFRWSDGRLTWTPRRALAPGRHAVRLVATDAAGARAVATWTFRVRR